MPKGEPIWFVEVQAWSHLHIYKSSNPIMNLSEAKFLEMESSKVAKWFYFKWRRWDTREWLEKLSHSVSYTERQQQMIMWVRWCEVATVQDSNSPPFFYFWYSFTRIPSFFFFFFPLTSYHPFVTHQSLSLSLSLSLPLPLPLPLIFVEKKKKTETMEWYFSLLNNSSTWSLSVHPSPEILRYSSLSVWNYTMLLWFLWKGSLSLSCFFTLRYISSQKNWILGCDLYPHLSGSPGLPPKYMGQRILSTFYCPCFLEMPLQYSFIWLKKKIITVY